MNSSSSVNTEIQPTSRLPLWWYKDNTSLITHMVRLLKKSMFVRRTEAIN